MDEIIPWNPTRLLSMYKLPAPLLVLLPPFMTHRLKTRMKSSPWQRLKDPARQRLKPSLQTLNCCSHKPCSCPLLFTNTCMNGFCSCQSTRNNSLLVNPRAPAREYWRLTVLSVALSTMCREGCQKQWAMLVAHLQTPQELGFEKAANAPRSQASSSWLPKKATNYHHKSCSYSSSGEQKLGFWWPKRP